MVVVVAAAAAAAVVAAAESSVQFAIGEWDMTFQVVTLQWRLTQN